MAESYIYVKDTELNALDDKVSKLEETVETINTDFESKGLGDMLKSRYDTNNDGVVDNAEKLGGQLPSYYARAEDLASKADTGHTHTEYAKVSDLGSKADKTHTHTKSQISDFPTSITPTAHNHTQDEITGLKNALSVKANSSDIPTKTSDLSNDSGFLTEHQDISGKANADLSNVEEDVLKTKIESFNLSGGCKIATGSYVGTGTYGINNPNTLSFGFEPKYIQIIKYDNVADYLSIVQTFIYPSDRGNLCFTDGMGGAIKVSWQFNLVSWYAMAYEPADEHYLNSVLQSNESGVTYYYVAIG